MTDLLTAGQQALLIRFACRWWAHDDQTFQAGAHRRGELVGGGPVVGLL